MRIRAALTAAALLAGLAACAAPEEKPTTVAASSAALNTSPDQKRIVPAKVDAIASLVPQAVRDTGKLTIGVGAAASGFPPLAFTATDNTTLIGNEPDLGVAIAGVLGLAPDLQNTSWENLFVGLDSGKYNVGASNITVTELRKQKYDFVTYRLDNLAWEVREDADLTITAPKDVAGKKVAVSSGTNQEKILVEWSKEAEKQGLKPIDIKYYQNNQAVYLALGSGQIDAYFTPQPQRRVPRVRRRADQDRRHLLRRRRQPPGQDRADHQEGQRPHQGARGRPGPADLVRRLRKDPRPLEPAQRGGHEGRGQPARPADRQQVGIRDGQNKE
nr:hypothetical protein GCM10020092_070840 [Actinoplanes digitatis]